MASESRVGTKIKLRRQALGLTQAQLAEKVGVHESTVTAWESGKQSPSRHLGKLEAVLRFSLDGGWHEEEVFEDPAEAALWALERYSPDERKRMIGQLRRDRERRRQARTAG